MARKIAILVIMLLGLAVFADMASTQTIEHASADATSISPDEPKI